MDSFERFSVEYSPNEIIFCEFEPGYEFYFIQSGKVKIVKVINNIEKTLDVITTGDVFGEMSILEHEPRSATAIALDHVKLLKFHRDNFDSLLEGNHELAYKLLLIFSKRIYDAKRRLMILLLDEPSLKIMDVFIMLAEQTQSVDPVNEMSFAVTPQQVASWAGMNLKNVQAELDKLIQLNKIDMYKDRIVVKNMRDFQRLVASRRKNMYS
ncbi:MAG: Crp/Fnr family transcriptional regulator [Spirochaetia bacterium]|nr:Crp/Fnr family transcriptional regulator [Spirochaetia bacterium]